MDMDKLEKICRFRWKERIKFNKLQSLKVVCEKLTKISLA